MGDDLSTRAAGESEVRRHVGGGIACDVSGRRAGCLRTPAVGVVRIPAGRRGAVHRAMDVLDQAAAPLCGVGPVRVAVRLLPLDRKSTRLNSSHPSISYAVFCLKKKKKNVQSSAPRLLASM